MKNRAVTMSACYVSENHCKNATLGYIKTSVHSPRPLLLICLSSPCPIAPPDTMAEIMLMKSPDQNIALLLNQRLIDFDAEMSACLFDMAEYFITWF